LIDNIDSDPIFDAAPRVSTFQLGQNSGIGIGIAAIDPNQGGVADSV
jgi:hypothetical protein